MNEGLGELKCRRHFVLSLFVKHVSGKLKSLCTYSTETLWQLEFHIEIKTEYY